VALDPQLVDRAVAEAKKRTENLDYFFDRLTSPEWIEPLRERGFFLEPPEQTIEEGLVRAPGWSQSRYLARVAEGAADLVLEIFGSLKTNNERVIEDLLDGALAMPIDQARRAAEIVERWILEREHVYYLVPRKAIDLICRLAPEAPESAVGLLEVLLKPLPAVREHDWLDSPTARFSEWEYDQHLRKIVREAVPAAPREFLEGLVHLLRESLKLLRESSESGVDDLSRVWRPRVNDDRDRATEIEESLTSAVRDAAVEIRKQRALTEGELVGLLMSGGDELLERIAMHALVQEPEPGLEVVRPLVLRPEILTDGEPSPEFQELLAAASTRLSSDEIEPLVKAVAEGPDVERYREMSERFDGQLPSDEQVDSFVARWKIARLALLSGALDPETRREYDELVAKHGESKITVSWDVSATYVGWNSPLSVDELEAKSNDELVTYLREWKEEGDRWGDAPSIEGLARAMASVTQRDPARMSHLASSLKELTPAYIQWILDGFESALRDGSDFEWSPVLELMEWVVAQPREIPGGRGDEYADLDPGWVWTRRRITSLLETGLNDLGPRSVPLVERERVWHLITVVADDPDPTPQHEEKYGGRNMDPATLSLNTTRPRALRAAIAYAIWVYRNVVGEETSTEEFVERIPEVRELLEAHLDPEHDSSPAVRAVFGQHYANVFAMDRTWGAEMAGSIFPGEDSPLREAAWGSYVLYTAPYNDVLEAIHQIYLRSAELVASEGHGFRWDNSPSEKLGEHIATFLWRGVLTLESELFVAFWSNAPASIRANTIEFLGRSAREVIPGSEIEERLISFWLFAKENVREGEEGETLNAFAWWFAAADLPADWRLTEAAELLAHGIQPEPAFLVAEQLPLIAEDHAREALQIMRLLIENGDVWSVDAWREHIEDVLRLALRSGDQETRRLGQETVDWLLARGYRNFRPLVEA
jgi:hypothetical protein